MECGAVMRRGNGLMRLMKQETKAGIYFIKEY
jgi:hypothetical protein